VRIDAELTLRRHHDLIAELTDLTARHPFRESLQGMRIDFAWRVRWTARMSARSPSAPES
jgi:hypothetical protein